MATRRRRPSLLGVMARTTMALIGGWIFYSAMLINRKQALPPAIDTERERFVGPNTRFLNVYVNRSGSLRPLVLIHSLNAAASAYEMRPIFEHYQGTRPIFALELPGFGFSERADRVYTIELMTEAILDLLTQKVDQPADVIALSLGSEFAARAALMRPDLFHSLALISPSGFNPPKRLINSQRASREGTTDRAYNILSFPLWGQALYDFLTTPQILRYYLNQSFEGEPDPGLLAYNHLTARQPGARYAPLYFVSGKLFSPDIRDEVYENLEIPVLVIYDRDNFVRFDSLPDIVERKPNWYSTRVSPTMGLPHFEKLPETAQALDAFWTEIAQHER
ncbi:MAG: alpha/beta hydrolase [Chloroflexi bacterium]|nr:alpha/beta hydrolase [Chloroflexota bacterium]